MVSMAVDQVAMLATSMMRTASFAMPERREVDLLTLSHERAAGDLYRLAGWLLRSSDLKVVIRQTPFLVEDTRGLWEYYQSLPLEWRPDRLVAVVLAMELLEQTGVLTRAQFPRLRRVLDVYTACVAAACVMPKQVFFQLHRACWFYETASAKRQLCQQQVPVPAVAEGISRARSGLESACSTAGFEPPSWLSLGRSDASAAGGSAFSLPSRSVVLLLSCCGAGFVVWAYGGDGVSRDVRRAFDGISLVGSDLQRRLARALRKGQPPEQRPPA
eukprot:TRINITY_DN23288_c0_g1_i1.p1 TRINITY_DN23288_c0_g1~~TRINITY_DN23288_c0_g1_i1.p1  ORF type:complete len:273 (-),score=32.55 TRINITY_DN23288_c0_g1_i1:124-942(-)